MTSRRRRRRRRDPSKHQLAFLEETVDVVQTHCFKTNSKATKLYKSSRSILLDTQ
jgi:hypothetical protein